MEAIGICMRRNDMIVVADGTRKMGSKNYVDKHHKKINHFNIINSPKSSFYDYQGFR